MQSVRRAWSDYCIIIPHFDTWITVWIPIVTHWFRLRISVGAVRIHHLEGKSSESEEEDPEDSSVCLHLGFFLHVASILTPSRPATPLASHRGETHKGSSNIFLPVAQKLVCPLIYCQLWDCEIEFGSIFLTLSVTVEVPTQPALHLFSEVSFQAK